MSQNVSAPPTRLSRVPARVPSTAATRVVGDVGLMFFLLRMAFWLGLVLILLPTGSSQREPAASEVDASDAISAASATVQDLRGFCGRQPGACTVGSQVATAIGYKAQAGAKMLYDLLTEALAPRETGSVGNGSRSALKTLPDKAAGNTSQNTLTPPDLAPAWRGPSPRKDGRHSV
jgi:Family of unknown function (DUF5330)